MRRGGRGETGLALVLDLRNFMSEVYLRLKHCAGGGSWDVHMGPWDLLNLEEAKRENP